MHQGSHVYWASIWLTVSIKIILVFVLAAVLCRTLLRNRPAWRSFIWLIVLAGFAWLTVLEWVGGAEPAAIVLLRDVPADVLEWAAFGWAVGAIFLLGFVVHAAIRLRLIRIYASSLAANLELPDAESAGAVGQLLHQIELCSSGQVAVPTAFGIWRPSIVLPAPIEGTIYRHLVRVSLVHEFVAVLRFDSLWTLLARLTQCAWFVHPVAWLAFRSYGRAREEVCDRWTVRATGDPADYELQLIALARSGAPRVPMSLDTPMCGTDPSALRRRVACLQNDDRPQSIPAWSGVVGLTAGLLALAFVAAMGCTHQAGPTRFILQPKPLWIGVSAALAVAAALSAVIVATRAHEPRFALPVDGLAGRSARSILACMERVAREWEQFQRGVRVAARRLEPAMLVVLVLAATITLWAIADRGGDRERRHDPLPQVEALGNGPHWP